MGCIFGYHGLPAEGLIERMAGILGHRCHLGWETARIESANGSVTEIGHGLAAWNLSTQIAVSKKRPAIFGYSGVIFKAHDPAASYNWELETQGPETTQYERRLRGPSICPGLLSDCIIEPDRSLENMEGAFAAALSLNGAIRLVRDPSGQKALYWTVTPKRLLFAGEVKALFADPDEPRELRMGALAEYLTFSFVPGEGTMFRGVYELQPGHMLLYENGAHKVRRFFSFEDHEWNENSSRSENYYVEETRKCLETSVAESLSVNDDPAVFLSGGIDSSAVLAVAANQRPDHRFRTFSVHFGSKYVNENQYIDLIVGKYDTRHSWLQIEPGRFLKKMDEIIWRLDEPIGDPITVPNYLLAEAASKDTNLVLNGEGGDPCFGGPKNIPMMLAAMYGPGQSANSCAGWLEKRYLASYRKCFSDLSLIMNQDAFRESGGYERLSTIITPFFQAEKPREFLNKLMSINIRLKGANLILVKVDKMTSANGVLALAPLFSKRIIINSMACPPWMKLNGNVEKSVLKRAVLDITPHEIVARPKSGMMVPVRFWLQGEMKRYAKRALSKKQLKKVGLFDPDYVSKILKYDKTEVQGARHGLKLWMLITFMLWHDRMLEGKY